MTLKKWLRKIVLFPMSIIMGIPDGDGFTAESLREVAGPDERPLSERIMEFAGNPDAQFMPGKPDAAASQADAVDADQQGNPGDETDEGLDTPSNEDDPDADLEDDDDADDTNSQETDESDEVQQKGTKKRTVEERAREIAEKIVKEALANRDKSKEQDQPNFAPPEMEQKVKLQIIRKQKEIRELEADIELDGDDVDPAKLDQLMGLEAFVSEAKKALKENARLRSEFLAKQATKQTTNDNGAAIRQELDNAAELYRAELKIEPDTWNKMGNWFESQINAKPLVREEFNDIFQKQGKVAAIRFAHEYAVKIGRAHV